MKILVVDDEPTILMAVAHLLGNRQDHAIETAGGLQEAKDALARDSFDLVISDLRMSRPDGMEGFELLSHIKKTSRETEVIIMTGLGSNSIRGDARCRDALCCLDKPLDRQELLRRVRQAAIKRGLEESLPMSGQQAMSVLGQA